MTVIVGVVDKGSVWMGGDSFGATPYAGLVRKDVKVFRVGCCLMGYTSSFRMGQLLRYKLNDDIVGRQLKAASDLHRFLATTFIDEVRRALKEGGYATKEKEAEQGGSFLVACRGRLFHVEADYQVGEASYGYDAVGSGREFAFGALHATARDTKLSAKDRVTRAVQAAAEFSVFVRPPIVILNLPHDTATQKRRRK